MRLVDVVLASALLGLGLGLLKSGLPSARASNAEAVAVDCAKTKCERIAWLRTPMMRRASYSE